MVQAPYQTFRYFKIFTLFMCVYECMSQGSDQQKEVWGAEGVSEMARWLKAPIAESDSWVLRGGMRTNKCSHTYVRAYSLSVTQYNRKAA